MKAKHNKHIHSTPSSEAVAGQPEDAFELINKYGTYNIQPTAESDNAFPAVGQGLSQADAAQAERARDEWLAGTPKPTPKQKRNPRP